ncbi:MAG: hypothetical protein ABIL68_14495, partial [bacterium]
EEYGSSDQISLAGEYVLHFKNLKIPLSIAYWVNWVPKTPDHVPHLKTGEDFFNYYVDYGLSFVDYHSYQFLDIDDDTNLRHNIFIGLNFPFRSFCLYLSSHLNLKSINILNNSIIPLSSFSWPMERFKSKRTTLILNLGVSFAFKSNG